MELRIIDSILHGALKPWKFDIANKRRVIELLKSAKDIKGNSLADLYTQLSILLKDYPNLHKLVANIPVNQKPAIPLWYKATLPGFNDPVTNYYQLLITTETVRLFNEVIEHAATLPEKIDIQYQISKFLNSIKVLTKQTSDELLEQGYETIPDENSDHIHHTLYYLKYSLILLFFSIQTYFEDELPQIISEEDFYILDLEMPISLSRQQKIEYSGPSNKGKASSNEYAGQQDTISFGFKGEIEKLRVVVNKLCFDIELLNEDVTTADDLIKALTAKSFLPGATKIQLNCETKLFRKCIDKFKPHFGNLTLENIARSRIFYSKNDVLITANNLSSSGSKNKVEPKGSANIDKIFKHMQ